MLAGKIRRLLRQSMEGSQGCRRAVGLGTGQGYEMLVVIRQIEIAKGEDMVGIGIARWICKGNQQAIHRAVLVLAGIRGPGDSLRIMLQDELIAAARGVQLNAMLAIQPGNPGEQQRNHALDLGAQDKQRYTHHPAG